MTSVMSMTGSNGTQVDVSFELASADLDNADTVAELVSALEAAASELSEEGDDTSVMSVQGDDGSHADIDFELVGADLDDADTVAELVEAMKMAQEELSEDADPYGDGNDGNTEHNPPDELTTRTRKKRRRRR